MLGYEVNDALNKPRTKLGVDFRIAIAVVFLGVLIGWAKSILLGVAFSACVLFAVGQINRREPRRYQLWLLSFKQFSYYDPGKERAK